MSEGRTLRLLFGDFDIEDSPGCANGSLVITGRNGEPSLGKVDEHLGALMMVAAVPQALSQQTCARPPILPGGPKNLTARKKNIQFSELWLLLDTARIVGKCCYMSVV